MADSTLKASAINGWVFTVAGITFIACAPIVAFMVDAPPKVSAVVFVGAVALVAMLNMVVTEFQTQIAHHNAVILDRLPPKQ